MRLLNQILGIGGRGKIAGGQLAHLTRNAPNANTNVKVTVRRNILQKRAVLVAEASDGFAFMVRRAFEQAKLPHMIRRVRDGAEALRYVAGQEEFADRQRFPYPDLLVVDSVLAKISGVELLGFLRGELGLRIPVVVFSPSLSPREMRRVTELGRADYLVRPDAFSVLLEEVDEIQRSWLEEEFTSKG